MNELDFMEFKYWLQHRDQDNSWITVAQNLHFEKDDIRYDYSTISVIAEKCDQKILLSDCNWLTDVKFGNQQVWEYHGRINFDFNSIEEKDGIKIEPFIISRNYGNETRFELIQDFILFYNLYFNEQRQIYKAINEMGEETDVVKVINNEEGKKIEIRTNYLKNYLNFKDKILIRQHDHNTDISKNLSELETSAYKTSHVKDNYNFTLIIDEFDTSTNDKESFSRLFGKDIILSSTKKKHLLGWNKEYQKFIIGITKDGDNIEETCNEEELENRNEKSNILYIKPVFFKSEVLKKYYDTSSKFTVTPSCLRCADFWMLPIFTGLEKLVCVYLGDLGQIPHKEQMHWKTYNVRPEGGIPEHMFQRDFRAEFTESYDLIYQFKNTLSKTQKIFSDKFGFILFKPLNGKDEFITKNFRILLNNEQVEFEQQLGYLAKMLPDSIDIKSLKKQFKAKDQRYQKVNNAKGSIQILELFLEKENISSDLVQILYKIQQIRSSGIAHRKGEEYERISEKYDLNENDKNEFFKKSITELTDAFKKINSQLT